jgi:hypothetical protein
VAVGAVLVAVGWFNNEDMYFGFIVMVMGLGFCGESRLNREIQELRYRIGELEYKNEQLERGRGLQQAGETASHSAPPTAIR